MNGTCSNVTELVQRKSFQAFKTAAKLHAYSEKRTLVINKRLYCYLKLLTYCVYPIVYILRIVINVRMIYVLLNEILVIILLTIHMVLLQVRGTVFD